jgi:hypothetical protein
MSKSESVKVTPNEIAERLGIPAKRVRSVIRSLTERDSQPGSGGRWELTDPEFVALIESECVARTNRKKSAGVPITKK